MEVSCGFQVDATVIANDFIDRYMAAANGEYVKVYLFVLRHQQEDLSLERVADALNHTEADVRRALAYWEKLGALSRKTEKETKAASEQAVAAAGVSAAVASAAKTSAAPAASAVKKAAAEKKAAPRRICSQEQVNQLAQDEDFTQLLYIAQKYLNKVFTQRECEVFAYLYDELHMSMELLEYLTEYCVQGGHTSIRYLETVALSWHEKGLRTVEEAKAYATGFSRDSFGVMKAFGLTDRRPGEAEQEMIERWFRVYGFSREVVLEACNRTLSTIHSPSFRYADKILMQWNAAGVKNLKDVAVLDQKHQGKTEGAQASPAKKPANQFHNFEQRDTDYDSIVLNRVKSWIGK